MPLQDDMKIISTDDHLVEPRHVWQDRLPAKFKEQGPKIVEQRGSRDLVYGRPVDEVAEVWQYEGRLYSQIALNAVAGRPLEDFGMEPMRYEQVRPGCYDPVERLKDMDVDGVWAELMFPTFPRFAGTTFLKGDDKDLALACVQAYNDFLIDEWCATAPDRFIPMVILPLWDVELCVREIERTAAKGARAIGFPENPVPLGLPSWHTDHWDPLFAAAQHFDLPLCMHFGTSGQPPKTSDDAPFPVTLTLYPCNLMYTASDLLFSQVFHKFDRLKVSLAEGGIGWIPFLLERADHTFRRHRFYNPDINQDVLPSEIFRKHIWGCFTEDEHGLAIRYEIGIDRLTFETDYPHSDSLWPNSRTYAQEAFKSVPDEEVRQIVELNSRALYNFF